MGVVTEKAMFKDVVWQIDVGVDMLAASYRCDAEMRMASGSREAEVPTGGPPVRAGGVVRQVDELGRIVIPVEIPSGSASATAIRSRSASREIPWC